MSRSALKYLSISKVKNNWFGESLSRPPGPKTTKMEGVGVLPKWNRKVTSPKSSRIILRSFWATLFSKFTVEMPPPPQTPNQAFSRLFYRNCSILWRPCCVVCALSWRPTGVPWGSLTHGPWGTPWLMAINHHSFTDSYQKLPENGLAKLWPWTENAISNWFKPWIGLQH